MKLTTSFACLVAAALLLPAVTNAAENRKPTIAVAPTVSTLPIWQPALGEGLAQMMTTELSRLTNIRVLESLALDDLREERDLDGRGEIRKSERIKKGEWDSADYTFKTIITRFASKQSSSGGSGPSFNPFNRGGVDVRTSLSEVQIDWRVIDNTSRSVVKSGRGTGTEKGTSWSFVGIGGRGSSDNREFLDSAMGKATMKAIACIVSELEDWSPPSRSGREDVTERRDTEILTSDRASRHAQRSCKAEVLLLEGDNVWVGLGASRGFVKGDRLKVYRTVEKRNKSGTVVVTDYVEVCELELTKVQDEKSCARRLTKASIEEGWIAALSNLDIDSIK